MVKMKTNWDYSELAVAYLARPQYSKAAVDALFAISGLNESDLSCDVGAGVGHLTKHYLQHDYKVVAVEPNDNMRSLGIQETGGKCEWFEGTGENTNQPTSSFDLVTFGSSFNVCDRELALKETNRILKPYGWFACMWNHRDLEDPIQSSIENIIKRLIPEYGYGTRREDQSSTINASGYFADIIQLSSDIVHFQSIKDCIEAWKSHATLQRQAPTKFNEIILEIEKFLSTEVSSSLDFELAIPYTTRIWLAQKTVN